MSAMVPTLGYATGPARRGNNNEALPRSYFSFTTRPLPLSSLVERTLQVQAADPARLSQAAAEVWEMIREETGPLLGGYASIAPTGQISEARLF
jgi:hypothetical protein